MARPIKKTESYFTPGNLETKKVSQIRYDPEMDRLFCGGEDLHCGQVLEVLIVDTLTGRSKWVEARLEYGDEWYLVGLKNYQVSGLFARI